MTYLPGTKLHIDVGLILQTKDVQRIEKYKIKVSWEEREHGSDMFILTVL